MAREPLFRQEVLDARADRQLGTIRLAQPIPDRVAAAVAIAIIGAIAAFAILGGYTRRAVVPGLLEPAGGTLRLTTGAAGSVALVHVDEGARVRRGDALFELSGDRRSVQGLPDEAIAAQLAGRLAALDGDARLVGERQALRSRTIADRLAAIDAEFGQLARAAVIHAARRRLAETNVERFETLARTGFVAPVQLQARQDELLVLQADGENDARLETNLGRERTTLAGELADSRLQADAERADLARQRAALEQERSENDARRSTVIVAPRDGIVTGIAVRAGQRIAGGALLATLIPDGAPLEAQLFASTRQIGFVARGQAVHLRYAAFPYQKFGMGDGVVASIEASPYAPQDLPSQVAATLGAALQAGEPVYRIVVRLDRQTIRTFGHDLPLRPGMVFEADVVQDHRRLFEWLLEPVYGLAAR